ncbi:hypothetical protein [Ignavibacterium sp.]|uniref:hypothetical protein n=2 Tax=Ignavibacterium sp. TaxID=2651167 RepID=UPI00307DB560
MRILHITPYYFPAIKFGGPIQSVHLLNKELVKKRLLVDVITTNAGLNSEQKTEILRQIQNDKDKWFPFLTFVIFGSVAFIAFFIEETPSAVFSVSRDILLIYLIFKVVNIFRKKIKY